MFTQKLFTIFLEKYKISTAEINVIFKKYKEMITEFAEFMSPTEVAEMIAEEEKLSKTSPDAI